MNTTERISKWTYYLLILPIALVFCGWQGWAWWNWVISPTTPTNLAETVGETIQLNIPSGTSTQQIGKDLRSSGLIHSTLAWKIWASWLTVRNPEGAFKAGTYKLSTRESLPAIADDIWQGQVMRLSFTVPEGWSRWDMAKYFDAQGYFSEEEFIKAISQIPKDRYPWLPDGIEHLEGFLYPDTYELASDRVTPQQVITLMLNRFQGVALPLYQQQKDKTTLSLLEWVTLSSIVEKEAVLAEERDRIAGVFSGRLADGMKLEADPTVEYALGIRQTPDKPLTNKQIQITSPYNTYRYPGLPPTPIASPGLSSLKATLSPEKTDYRYFVARYDGTHLFTKTLEEHKAAVNAIRQQRKALKNKPE
ncbi:endolytic transglycosylase MltG [Lusitaniella coriacea LEGE 07157]|uniref:Endolytic murein transglycosylase n=1 Tax=Lusitaniella coriacea LEGE 07157 TaxID=945747 RepID=A0A8J7IUI6_9CYAN|nr:endolytic transglycosylase MltG [Lusitaniella coriacea]MBE9116548.1 endolytic transglycosylase MltG [Lusitaniella coriacea LEGE 07157]